MIVKSDSVDVGSAILRDDDPRGVFPQHMPWDEQLELEQSELQILEEEDPEVLLESPDKIVIEDINDKFIYNRLGLKTYWNKPWFKGLFDKEGMRKLGHPITKVFLLSISELLEQYNELMKCTGAEGEDPSIVIVFHDRLFWEGNYIALVTYREVWYLLAKQG